MTKLEAITEILKTRFDADIEIRAGSFLPEFRNIAFGGARIFDLDCEELVVSVNLVSYTGITLLDFEIDGIRYGGKFVKETAADKLERETAALKAEMEARGKPFEIDRRDYTFEFGEQIFVGRMVPMPARFGDDVVVVARPNGTRHVGKVQHYFFDGDHYLVIVKPEDFRDTYEEYQEAKAQKDAALKVERAHAASEGLALAKKLGGKVLKGTAKQKAWANQIRGEAVARMSAEDAKFILKSGLYDEADFWIRHRERLATADLVKFFNIKKV